MRYSIFRSRALYIIVVLSCVNISGTEKAQSDGKAWIAPLFISDAHVLSLLMVENSENHPADLIAILESLEGQQIGSRPFLVGAHSSVTIEVGRIPMIRHRFPEVGSIILTGDTNRTGRIRGHLTITTPDHSFALEEPLQLVAETPRLSQRASVTFASAVPVVAIHSLAATTQSLSIRCMDAQGQSYESEMSLPPHMTFLRNACISSRRESRTYEEVLRGDIGTTKGPMRIGIAVRERSGGVAAWGFAGISRTDSNPRIASIQFSE